MQVSAKATQFQLPFARTAQPHLLRDHSDQPIFVGAIQHLLYLLVALLLQQQRAPVFPLFVRLALSECLCDPVRLFRCELDSSNNLCEQRRQDFLSHVAGLARASIARAMVVHVPTLPALRRDSAAARPAGEQTGVRKPMLDVPRSVCIPERSAQRVLKVADQILKAGTRVVELAASSARILRPQIDVTIRGSGTIESDATTAAGKPQIPCLSAPVEKSAAAKDEEYHDDDEERVGVH